MAINSFTQTRRNLPHWQQPGSVYSLCWRVISGRVLDPEDRTLVLNAIRFWDGKKWFVQVAVVMPDHVHAIVRPLPLEPDTTDVFDLAELLKSSKGYSSFAVNRRQEKRGTLWQDERYDRIIRDEEEFEETWNYMRYNPVRANLVATPEEYQWLHQAPVERV